VDGAVVMVENIFRELAARRANTTTWSTVNSRGGARRGAAHLLRHRGDHRGIPADYVLTGPSGRLFQPMADTMSFALLGSLLCALTLLPVLCAYFLRKNIHEPHNIVFEWIRRCMAACWAPVWRHRFSDGAWWCWRCSPLRCC